MSDLPKNADIKAQIIEPNENREWVSKYSIKRNFPKRADITAPTVEPNENREWVSKYSIKRNIPKRADITAPTFKPNENRKWVSKFCIKRNFPKRADIMAPIIKPNGKRRWVPKYGLTAIPKLIEFCNQLNPLRVVNMWPKKYKKALQVDSTCWKQVLYSLITTNEEDNMTTVNNATAIFDKLFQQFVNKDLWISLCENISEIIKEESLYQKIIQLVLLTALHEKDGIHNRIAEMSSLLSKNPWYIMCKNILPLVVDEYQKCYIALLFLALSGQQKVFLFDYLTGNTKEMVQTNKTENIFSFLFMTQEHWVDLTQVVELLMQKREILKMLSVDAKCASDLPGNEQNQNLKSDAVTPIKKEDFIISNKMYVENAEMTASLYGEIKQNQIGDVATTVVKSENYKVEEDENVSTNDKITIVKQEANIDGVLDVIQAENIELKQEILIKEEDTKVFKLENIKIEEEENDEQAHDTNAPLPNLDEIKTEQVCENILIVDEENRKEQTLLDKLILDYSIKQINIASAFTINEECINILSDDDFSDDCVIHEDNKLEVAQLLNMYHEIVDKPEKNEGIFAAAENISQVENINEIDVSEEYHDSKRKPSTSSCISSKSDKMLNATMSSQKLLNKIKRKRSKKNARVKKLFEQLRNESLASSSTADNTVIVLDDTITPKKRKCTPTAEKNMIKRKRYFSKNVPDACTPIKLAEAQEINQSTHRKSSPVHCFTPIKNNADFIPITSKSNNNIKAVQNLNEDVTDLTKEINYDSLITVDLTTETLNRSSVSKFQNTVIDLDDTANNNNADCSIVSVSNSNLSLSGESDVTVLNISQTKKERQMRNFAKGISKLDAAEKGRLLELITQNIFSDCVHNDPRETTTRATETAEDTYIKEVILGQTASRNSIGSNIYNPDKDVNNKTGLRMVVIDGSNVAMEHGRGRIFSVKGLKICIDYFLRRGHAVKAFVPRFRCKFGKSSDPRLLDELERAGLVVYTPSREIQGRMITPYDDRYIVQCAAEFDGVIVSGDNYRDLVQENPRWRFVIENRVLPFTWVDDVLMLPKDPLARNGPTLDQFLRHPEAGPAVGQTSFFIGGPPLGGCQF